MKARPKNWQNFGHYHSFNFRNYVDNCVSNFGVTVNGLSFLHWVSQMGIAGTTVHNYHRNCGYGLSKIVVELNHRLWVRAGEFRRFNIGRHWWEVVNGLQYRYVAEFTCCNWFSVSTLYGTVIVRCSSKDSRLHLRWSQKFVKWNYSVERNSELPINIISVKQKPTETHNGNNCLELAGNMEKKLIKWVQWKLATTCVSIGRFECVC